jgi:hypothetical protein
MVVLMKPPITRVASSLECGSQTVRNAIHDFNKEVVLEALKPGSSRPGHLYVAFDEEGAEACAGSRL